MKTTHLYCHVLSLDPIIIIGYGSPGPFEPAVTLCERLKDHKIYFLLGAWWTLQDPTQLRATLYHYYEHVQRRPNHSFAYMCNNEEDMELLKRHGVPCFFCHQNAFVDERVFYIEPETPRIYDAVYNARMDPFKRHILCRKLDKPAFIYYCIDWNREENKNYFRYIMRTVPQVHLFNDNYVENRFKWLHPPDMRHAYNQCRTGLCLSEVEGAMYASVEYMLCGLPVVSTPSVGGRDFFFDAEFTRVVEPDPRAVRKAVRQLVEAHIPPELVRKKTLLRCMRQRDALIDVVQAIYDQEGVSRRFRDEWDTVFVNKMLVWGIPDFQVIEYIEKHAGHSGPVVDVLTRDYARN